MLRSYHLPVSAEDYRAVHPLLSPPPLVAPLIYLLLLRQATTNPSHLQPTGVGSDIIVSRLHLSRFWMLLLSSLVFLLGQIAAISITIPQQLVLVSSLNGFAYGVLFGVGPALVVEAFGIRGLSQNWGIMTLAPILFGNIFNLVYGGVYDSHSTVVGGKDRHRSCDGGVECYRSAYLVTMAASVVGVVLSLWSIRHDYLGKLKRAKRERERDERREA